MEKNTTLTKTYILRVFEPKSMQKKHHICGNEFPLPEICHLGVFQRNRQQNAK